MQNPALFGSLGHLDQRERLLLEAVAEQDLSAVQQQLAAGADVAAAGGKGLTALHGAAATAQDRMVSALLAAGADASVKVLCGDYKGRTPLQYMMVAAKRGHVDYLDCPLHRGEALVQPVHQCGACCEAAAQVVQQLVEAGGSVLRCTTYATPLLYAARAECPTRVAALLEAGADVGHVTPLGYSVLHAASERGSLEVVQQVLSALGSSRAADMLRTLGRWGYGCMSAPLHLAASRGVYEVVEALVAAGADLEQRDAENCSPLQQAVTSGMCHLVPLLVTPDFINQPCDPPLLHLAARLPWQHFYSDIGWRRQPLVTAAANMVAGLLAAGADPMEKDHDGVTVLAKAAGKGCPEVLRVLLKHELQRRTQQQQQQQQQVGYGHVLPGLLREVAAYATVEAYPGSGTWRLLLTLAAEEGGEQAVNSLWKHLRKQLQLEETPITPWEARSVAHSKRLRAWQPGTLGAQRATDATRISQSCWVSACLDVATQQSCVTRRLEQLVTRPHHHQQPQQEQEQAPAAARRASEAAAVPTMPCQGCNNSSDNASSSSRAPHADAGGAVPVASQTKVLKAAAARGREQEVRTVLGQLPDRAKGLSHAAVAAGQAGHWGLCTGLLRELVTLRPTQLLWYTVNSELQKIQSWHEQQLSKRQRQRQKEATQQQGQQLQEEALGGDAVADASVVAPAVEANLRVCDALLADCFVVWQQQVQERRTVVVAAVAAAVDAAAAPANLQV